MYMYVSIHMYTHIMCMYTETYETFRDPIARQKHRQQIEVKHETGNNMSL